MDIRVRPAKHGDEDLILEFIMRKAVFDKRKKEQVGITAEKIRTHAFTDDASFYVLFAVDGDKPVACMIYYFSFVSHHCAPVLYIEQTIVNENYRKPEVVMPLFSEVAHVAKARGCDCLGTRIFSDNQVAIDFLQSTGAEVMKEIDLLAIRGNGFDKLISGE